MKKIFLFFLIIATLQSIAQNANWGTGLPVTVNINGSNVELSVFDPNLNQTRTTSLSVGSNPTYENSDGVVVAYGNSGYMYYAIYDIELQYWKTGSTQISSSNSAGTVLTADGVVVGYGTQGYMDYATYDVELQYWKTGSTQISSSNSAGTILTADGVVVGYGTQGYMDYATYDVELQYWKTGSTQISSSNSAGTVLTADGVVVGYGTQGYMDYATYDVELQYWKTGSTQISSSNSAGTIHTSAGVVAGYGTQGYIDYAIYDFDLGYWKTGSKQIGSSGSFSISSGTITYSGSSSGIVGYNPSSQNWGNYNTTPTCKFLPVVSSNSLWVFMRCMSIGASTFTYSSGDGHQISRKQGWKKYNSKNTYNATLNVSNGINNSTCNTTISLATGIEEYNNQIFQIFPNPADDNIFIDCAEKKGLILQVYNELGENILQRDLANGKNIIDISSLSSGVYVIRLIGSEETYQQKLIKN